MQRLDNQAVKAMHMLVCDRSVCQADSDVVISVLERSDDITAVALGIHRLESSKLISTAFTSSPATYLPDYGSLVPGNVEFIRITLARLLDKRDRNILQDRMSRFVCKAILKIVPEKYALTGPCGLFVRMCDGTYFSFLAISDPWHQENSRRILVSGNLARLFFQYYDRLTCVGD